MDDSSEDQDCSLKDILMAVKSQGDDNTKLRQEISNLRQEMHGGSLSVSSQVKKLKTDSQYAWKYEGNKVQYLLNYEFLAELAQAVWAIDNLKFEHAKSIQSNPPQFAASSFPVKNQSFREPQTWYAGFPVYQNQPGTSGYQRRGQQGGGCFSCGSFQHWRNQCPFNSKSIQQKPKAD